MTATAAPASTDRNDFRSILIAGTKTGLVTTGAVVVFLVLTRLPLLPDGMVRQAILTLLLLAAGVAVSFLPGRWLGARGVEGVAAAAGAGLWGTVTFMALDIVVLRPVKAFPWTWDAIGGGSTWWYLPVWWMLGTFLAWMGAIVTAGAARTSGAGESPSWPRTAGPALLGTVVMVTVGRLAGLDASLLFEVGVAYTATLALLAIGALARKS